MAEHDHDFSAELLTKRPPESPAKDDGYATVDAGERRAKFMFDRPTMHQALGLPDDVRIVSMHVTPDPDQLHVIVEGAGVPVGQARPWTDGDDYMGAAYRGELGTWTLPHPYHRLRVHFDGWKVGDPVDDSARGRIDV